MSRIRIEWGNTCDIGKTLYQKGYHNVVYFDTIIGLPRTNHITEGNENGRGDLIPTLQRRAKTYQMEVYVPEYLIDALQDIRLHNTITITVLDPLTLYEVINPTSVVVEMNYEFAGCQATAIISFEARELILKSGCCENTDVPPCPFDNTYTGECSTDTVFAGTHGFYLFIQPSLLYPQAFEGDLYWLSSTGWVIVSANVNDTFYCFADNSYWQLTSLPDPYPLSDGSSPNVLVWILVPSVFSVEYPTTTTALIKLRVPRGTWSTITTGCVTPVAFDSVEHWSEDLLLTGITVPVPECGKYCLNISSRKAGCDLFETQLELFHVPDPLAITYYVRQVYAANLCPIPYNNPSYTMIFLILPETPCTNNIVICNHQNEIIFWNAFTLALDYFVPAPCDVVYDLSNGDRWVWNDDDSEWQLIP